MKDMNSISELTSIINSRTYRQVLEERKAYLQNEANTFIRQQKWFEAYGAIMRMDDLLQTLEMLGKKLTDIRKEK